MIVNVFSRAQISHVTYNSSEYYICINSSGGPDSIPLFSFNSHNIINMWFDDVEYDQYRWGEDIKHWYSAKAITYQQANCLFSFIESIPINSVVNVYCSKGSSRSGAVAEFLKKEKLARVISENTLNPNKRVFAFLMNAKYKFIQPIKFKFMLDELLDYYYNIEQNYQHLKWSLDYVDEIVGAEKHRLDGVYGWGIQSNLDDLSKPCPPYDIHKKGSVIYRNTELVFGFAQALLDRFPYARQMGIAVHPMQVNIKEHVDNSEYVKIHFPIISTDNSYFCFGEYCFVLDPGLGYLIDTRYPHHTNQLGQGLRAHLLIKLPIDKIDDALK
jgi:hypothetical protein